MKNLFIFILILGISIISACKKDNDNTPCGCGIDTLKEGEDYSISVVPSTKGDTTAISLEDNILFTLNEVDSIMKKKYFLIKDQNFYEKVIKGYGLNREVLYFLDSNNNENQTWLIVPNPKIDFNKEFFVCLNASIDIYRLPQAKIKIIANKDYLHFDYQLIYIDWLTTGLPPSSNLVFIKINKKYLKDSVNINVLTPKTRIIQ